MTADRAAAFKAALAALNSQFATWVAAQATAHPTALWADGARDYVKHAASLVDEYKDVLGAAAATPVTETAPAPAPASTGLFGAPAAAPAAPLFGGPSAPAGGLFGAPPPAGGGFGGFGGFGGAGGFGAAPPAAGPPAADDDDDDEAEEAEEATPAALDAGAAIAFKASARLHAMPPGAGKWVDRGRGVLTLREGGSGGGEGAPPARPHIVFTTDTGRVLLNAALYKGLATRKAKKPNMVTANLANAAAIPGEGDEASGGGPPVLAPHLFGLGSEAEADAFSAALADAVAKHCA